MKNTSDSLPLPFPARKWDTERSKEDWVGKIRNVKTTTTTTTFSYWIEGEKDNLKYNANKKSSVQIQFFNSLKKLCSSNWNIWFNSCTHTRTIHHTQNKEPITSASCETPKDYYRELQSWEAMMKCPVLHASLYIGFHKFKSRNMKMDIGRWKVSSSCRGK